MKPDEADKRAEMLVEKIMNIEPRDSEVANAILGTYCMLASQIYEVSRHCHEIERNLAVESSDKIELARKCEALEHWANRFQGLASKALGIE